MSTDSLRWRLLRAGLLLLAVAMLVYLLVGRVCSDSVDLAHHYALVQRLAEFGNRPFPYDPSLGEMNSYPRLAHQMAVVVGRLAGSSMLGMQLLAVLSLAVVWAGLLWLVTGLPKRVANRAALMLLVFFVANHLKIRLPVHGAELIGGYYYSQLVGQAALVLVLVASMMLERRAAPAWLRHALLVPAIYLVTGIHLLPALLLLLVMGWLVLADTIAHWRLRLPGLPGLAVRSAVGAGLLLGALGVLASHPAFATMREISKNNGVIVVRHLQSLPALVGLSVIVAVGSGAVLLFWLRRQQDRSWLPLKYIAVLGLSVSCLALVQAAALRLGFGSDYALRKYAFALASMAVLLALLPGLLKSRQPQSVEADADAVPPGRLALPYSAMPALLVLVACLSVAWQPERFQTTSLVAVEQSVQDLARRMGPPPAGKFDYVLGLQGMSAAIDYMYSIAQLRIPRWDNPNGQSVLVDHAIADWGLVARLITSENSRWDRYPECRTGLARSGLVVLDGACLQRHLVSSAQP